METWIDTCLIGRRDGTIELFNLIEGSTDTLRSLDDQLVGVHGLKTSAKLAAATVAGGIEIFQVDREADEFHTKVKAKWQVGKPIEACTLDKSRHVIATGGNENNVQLFDIETQENIFSARSPKPNELGIWDKPWITTLAFTEDSADVILAGTANHQLRLYDCRAKRRPIFEVEHGENRITSMCIGTQGEILQIHLFELCAHCMHFKALQCGVGMALVCCLCWT